ncbi:MAG: hypothetical protein IT328_23430 [Caldilineaceae bacterium]|nr:hypothetical protein [Caldilineaceae bacterium]
MNKKQIDSSVIENELKGASLFFATPQQSERPIPQTDDNLGKMAEGDKQEPHLSQKTRPKDQWVPQTAAVSEARQPAIEPESANGGMHPQVEPCHSDPSSQVSKQETMQAIEQAGYHASKQATMIEEIRQIAKAIGSKTTFVRLTPEEKGRLLDVVYTYKRQGIRTSENELVRIAIGYLLGDYNESGKESTLDKVLAALNA